MIDQPKPRVDSDVLRCNSVSTTHPLVQKHNQALAAGAECMRKHEAAGAHKLHVVAAAYVSVCKPPM